MFFFLLLLRRSRLSVTYGERALALALRFRYSLVLAKQFYLSFVFLNLNPMQNKEKLGFLMFLTLLFFGNLLLGAFKLWLF